MRRIEQDYYEWLVSFVEFGHEDYILLLKALYNTEFTWTVSRDSNRAEDGLELRSNFLDEYMYGNCYGNKYNSIKGPCNVLEMLIALARRCEDDIMQDPDEGDRTSEWFWMMISNLGLEEETDDYFCRDRVDYILSRFLNRQYRKDGRNGGLFYTNYRHKDYRKVELWYQLCWYLDEHYSFAI